MGLLVSIITPCYQQGNFLSDAIDSALAQSHKPIELIVVNDGSDDDTDAVAARYEDNIKYIRQSNGGLASARNMGIDAATGRFLVFLDADDLLHPNALEWLVNAMADRDDSLAIMGCRYFQADPSSGTEWTVPAGFNLLPALFTDNIAPPHCFMCSRSMVVARQGFRADPCGCEDWDLWLRLALDGAVPRIVPRVGAFYRRHANSMSKNAEKMDRGSMHVLLNAIDEIQSNPAAIARWGSELPALRRRIAGFHSSVAYHSGKRGALRESLKLHNQAMRFGQSPPKALMGMVKAAAHALAHSRA